MKYLIPFLILGVSVSLVQSTVDEVDDPMICTGVHEVFSKCGDNACVSNCATYGKVKPACSAICRPGCVCESGFLRNNMGVCVHPLQCENNICEGQNEQYSGCVSPCGETCQNLGQPLTCNYDACYAGCDCMPGFFRNSVGSCVPAEECENNPCPGKNEGFSKCVSPCGETCRNLGQNIVCNFLVCNQGCACKQGFFRNGDGSCVPPEECDCGGERTNQELDLCHNPCPPEGCKDIDKMFKCAAPEVCKPACKCKRNYKRVRTGQCIDIRDCPQLLKCEANEVYDACPPFCMNEYCIRESRLACSSIRMEFLTCKPQCLCQEGYCRNNMEVCVDNTPYACDGDINADPTNDCECKEGFMFNKEDKCVPIIRCTDPNSRLVTCPNPCPGGTCDQPAFTPCKKMCPDLGCQCKKGFVKKSSTNPTCIALKKCPKKPKF